MLSPSVVSASAGGTTRSVSFRGRSPSGPISPRSSSRWRFSMAVRPRVGGRDHEGNVRRLRGPADAGASALSRKGWSRADSRKAAILIAAVLGACTVAPSVSVFDLPASRVRVPPPPGGFNAEERYQRGHYLEVERY